VVQLFPLIVATTGGALNIDVTVLNSTTAGTIHTSGTKYIKWNINNNNGQLLLYCAKNITMGRNLITK